MSGQTDYQDEVLAFLADPANYGGAKVKRIDTHAASVFLAGAYRSLLQTYVPD